MYSTHDGTTNMYKTSDKLKVKEAQQIQLPKYRGYNHCLKAANVLPQEDEKGQDHP